ncbi:MAG: DUF2167 domain-containing protein [bacterium]|nr:MAG: DUF2167 domain-containing protein [bacterium]
MDRKRRIQGAVLALAVVMALAASAAAQEEGSAVQWIEGPRAVDLGDNLAQLDMSEAYLFAGPEDTRAVMEYLGNPPTNAEMGMIIPNNEEGDWFIVFEYFEVGYIKDDDGDEIDAAAILESYREGTEQANKEREKMGAAPIHVAGWYEQPHYDPATNNLTWAMLLEDDEKNQTVNYNVRILGRRGYVSAVLVADPERLTALKGDVEGVVANLTYKSGSRYAEYVKGDKLAQIGLTALIAGGAGAAAVKLGLFQALAKFWKAIMVAILAFFASVWKVIKRVFRTEEKLPMGQPPQGRLET